MVYSSSSSYFSPSCQFRLFPLFAISVGFLLLMASKFGSALECYYNLHDKSSGGRPADLQLNANGGNGTIHCSAKYPHCISLHCRAQYGVDKTIKSCAKYPDGITTPEAACNYIRDKEFCGDDPKYYCRYCDTDLCNNEPE